MEVITPFHLAFPVTDLAETKNFYCRILDCKIARETSQWVDLDFFGHQITAHKSKTALTKAFSTVDGKKVPIPHFGLIIQMPRWKDLSSKLLREPTICWISKPSLRFENKPSEQATLLFFDPSKNAIEIKAFANFNQIFALN